MLSKNRLRGRGEANASGRLAGRALRIESLEDRMLLYNLGAIPWPETNLSFSFAPDGTAWLGGSSVLFAEIDAIAPRDVWQREFARALQTWAKHSNLNFHESRDDGKWNGVKETSDWRR